ncbi:uncharacterized protein [Zea mays]|uniref:uncharacterized protein n=1 Tax=Zea mays TaxID=4577 RepID=UPI0009AA64B2|nr:uncharacterized protein LOC109945191 [Zea mays]|eukprot:XP_020406610.1 uncharacterized protein LOC109945191 [Zea mays]
MNADESDNETKQRGSIKGHRVLQRDRQAGYQRLYQDYFLDNPTYGHYYFRRRFRMRRSLFVRIWKAVEQHDQYFVQKRNTAGTLGLSSLQKITAAFRMLSYGVAADATDDYVRIGESTTIESLRRFVCSVVEVFGDEYLRTPNEDDTARLLAIGESRGFSADGEAPKVNYTINNNEYTMGYYLADGIYPSWATFVKTIPEPRGNKKKYFATAQEACRKDVERAFGVLQSRFAIVRGPARFWDGDTLGQIMRACVIMHNMIVEDERDDEHDINYEGVGDKVNTSHEETPELEEFIHNYRKIKDKGIHTQLQDDLIEHIWQHHPDLYN